MDSFYVTLPSNSSMNVYPDNTLTYFTTLLSKPLDLRGKWEVAMTGISYTRSWYDITKADGSFDYKMGSDQPWVQNRYTIRTDLDPREIAQRLTLNGAGILFEYLPGGGKFSVRLKTEGPEHCQIKANGRLSALLGLREVMTLVTELTTDKRGNEVSYAHYKMNGIADLQPIRQLYVYTDIIDHQMVGDTTAPLLRNVPVEGKFGSMVNIDFSKLEYKSVSTSLVNTINIDIRDDTGKRIPFNNGRVIVKLHFRQKL